MLWSIDKIKHTIYRPTQIIHSLITGQGSLCLFSELA